MRDHYLKQYESMLELFGNEDGSIPPAMQDLFDSATLNHERLQLLYADLDTNGFGLTLVHSSGKSWAIVIEDASYSGYFRYQCFKENGFMSHFTYPSADEALADAYQSGYTSLANRDTLDRLCGTPEWNQGMEILNIITQLNANEITWDEAEQLRTKVIAKYQCAA